SSCIRVVSLFFLFFLNESLGQTGLLVPRVQRKIEYGYASISEPISDPGAQQTAVGAHIDPEALLGRVVGHLVRKLRSQQRIAPHQRQHTATVIVKPINRPSGGVPPYSFFFVFEG